MERDILAVINFIGGLSLFLLSMNFLGVGMKKLSSQHLKRFLKLVTDSKFGGVVFGFIFTLFFQSSSAVTVVLVSFIDAGIISLFHTLPVLLGAGIGTTIAAQLITLNLANYSLLIISVGVFVFLFGNGKVKSLGTVVLAVGLIFFSIKTMSDTLIPYRDSALILDVMSYVKNPWLGAIFGLLVTSLIHSSAGFIGLLIVLAHNHLIDFSQTLPLLIGANIGTTATAHLAALNSIPEAKKMAIVNSLYRIILAIFASLFIFQWEYITIQITGSEADIANKIANAHTIFNIVMTIVLFPFINPIYKLVNSIKFSKAEAKLPSLKYIKGELLESQHYIAPVIKKEIAQMFDETKKMIEWSILPFMERDPKIYKKIDEQELVIDYYKNELSEILLKVNTAGYYKHDTKQLFIYLHIINELEQIADVVSVNILKLARKMEEQGVRFSEEGKDELKRYHAYCLENIDATQGVFTFFSTGNGTVSLIAGERVLDEYSYSLEIKHFKRLMEDSVVSKESSSVHIELLNQYRIINSRMINLTRIISNPE